MRGGLQLELFVDEAHFLDAGAGEVGHDVLEELDRNGICWPGGINYL